MKWFVGVDLRERSNGALRWCQWAAAHDKRVEAGSIVPVHVIEDRELSPLKAHISLSEIERMSRESATTAVSSAGGGAFAPLQVRHDANAESAMADLADEAGDDAVLVVGRKAPVGSVAWVRLGRVARRLLRAVSCPVVVVPPDFEPPADDKGPIVLAVSLGRDSEAAAKFAVETGKAWDRPVVVVHVTPSIAVGYPPFADSAVVHQVATQLRTDADRQLADFMSAHGLATARRHTTVGDVSDRILTIARDERASLIVVGSRKLSLAARVYSSTVGPEVAGTATCPVAVVPAADADEA